MQEILADGQYKIARFYYLKMDYRASTARLVELSERYPLYSQSDEALWMLGDVYFKVKEASKNEDDKNHWSDLAAQCYNRIIENYPLSKRTADAKGRLTSMGMKVPQPDPNALARMQKEQLYAKNHRQNPMIKLPIGFVKSGPDFATAAHSGDPNLNPPDDAVSATEVLKPGASGPTFNLAMRPSSVEDPNADQVTQGIPARLRLSWSSVTSRFFARGRHERGRRDHFRGPNVGRWKAPTASCGVKTAGTRHNTISDDTGKQREFDQRANRGSAVRRRKRRRPLLQRPQPSPSTGSAPPGTEAPSLVTTQSATTGSNGTADAAPEKTKRVIRKTESTSKKKKGIPTSSFHSDARGVPL